MIEINLLPVRAARKQESLRFQLTIFVLIFIFLIIGIFFINASLVKQDKKLDKEKDLVETEIAKLEAKVGEIDQLKKERAKLEQKLAVIGDLDKGRLRASYILDQLSQLIPEKMWLESLEKSGKSIKIAGVALDNETIANFMEELGRSKKFTDIDLEVTEQINRGSMKLMRFILRCSAAA
jgi:type IV pilus assembly protein PilN